MLSLSLDELKQRMQRSVDSFASDIAGIRTGRATSALVENIIVPAYGGTQKLRVLEVGSINVTDPQTITIQPWDESIIGDIRKGIAEANVGLNPTIDGSLIRIAVPSLSAERRQEYVKLLHQKLEAARISIRQIRHDKMGELKRAQEAKEITEDDQVRVEKQLQEETDRCVFRIEELGKKKEEELVTV